MEKWRKWEEITGDGELFDYYSAVECIYPEELIIYKAIFHYEMPFTKWLFHKVNLRKLIYKAYREIEDFPHFISMLDEEMTEEYDRDIEYDRRMIDQSFWNDRNVR